MLEEKYTKCSTTSRAQSRAFSRVRKLWSKVVCGSLLDLLAWAMAAKCTMALGLVAEWPGPCDGSSGRPPWQS